MAAETMEMMNSMIPAINNREFQAIVACTKVLYHEVNVSIIFVGINIIFYGISMVDA